MENTLTLQGMEQGRLSDAVYETLLDAILSNRLASGTIVSEVALSKKLNVSRTPVHDALRQLSKDGLVDQRPGRRAVIRTFSKEDIFDIFEMRKLLEGEAARRATGRIDRATLANLRQQANELAETLGTPDWVKRWADFDGAFHEAIAHASGSQRLFEDIVRYHLLHRSFNVLRTTPEDLQRALREHLNILEMLEQRQAEQAAAKMVDHIAEWQAYFVNHFQSN